MIPPESYRTRFERLMLARIFRDNLRARPHERVLVITDMAAGGPRPLTLLAMAAARAGLSLTRASIHAFPETGEHGVEPPEETWIAAFGAEAVRRLRADGTLNAIMAKRARSAQLARASDIVRRFADRVPDAAVFMTFFSATHTKFRELLSSVAGTRVASMPGFEARMLGSAMTADWREVATRSKRVKAALDRAHGALIESPEGTRIELGLKGRKAIAESGVFSRGRFGNLPAGETFIAPVEGSAEGVLVAHRGPRGRFSPGMRFVLRGGRARRVSGGRGAGARLAALFGRRPEFSLIAELGVGTNDRARDGHILEAEKILGTVHLAFGDNATFGGANRAAFHQDFVVRRPTVTLFMPGGRRRILLSRGHLLVEGAKA